MANMLDIMQILLSFVLGVVTGYVLVAALLVVSMYLQRNDSDD